jgi:hypothetical protein
VEGIGNVKVSMYCSEVITLLGNWNERWVESNNSPLTLEGDCRFCVRFPFFDCGEGGDDCDVDAVDDEGVGARLVIMSSVCSASTTSCSGAGDNGGGGLVVGGLGVDCDCVRNVSE